MSDETEITSQEFTQEDINQNKAMAILAYIIWLIPLLAAQNSKFARYHTNQGLLLCICSVAAFVVLSIIMAVLSAVPAIGFLAVIIGIIVWALLPLLILVLAILGIVNAANGQAKPLPIIGNLFTILK